LAQAIIDVLQQESGAPDPEDAPVLSAAQREATDIE
jgi:hypothetical protein